MKHLALFLAAAALAACTERPQTLQSGTRSDTPAFQGSATTVFTVPGWKPGDRTSWDSELKTRAQFQNEYNKVN